MLVTAGAGIFMLSVRAASIDASSFLQANAALGAYMHNASKESVEKYTVVHYTDVTCTERAGTEDQFSPSHVPGCYNVVAGELQGGSFKVACPKEGLEEVNQFIYQRPNCKGEEMDKKRLKWDFFEGQCSKKLVMKPVMRWRDLPACKTKALSAVGVPKKRHAAVADVTDILTGKHVAGKSKRVSKVEGSEDNIADRDTARTRRHHGKPSEKDWEKLIEDKEKAAARAKEKTELAEEKARLAAEKAAEKARMAAEKAKLAQKSKDNARAAGKADEAWQAALERVQAEEKAEQDAAEDADDRGAQDDLDKFVGEGIKVSEALARSTGATSAGEVSEALARSTGATSAGEAAGAEAGSNATRGGEKRSNKHQDGERVPAVENPSATKPDDVHEDAERDPATAAPSSARLADAHEDTGPESQVHWKIEVADKENMEARHEAPKSKLLKAKESKPRTQTPHEKTHQARRSSSPRPPTRTQGLALFDEIDSDQSGTMSSTELSGAFDSDHIRHHFKHFQLNVTDVQGFFDGMDVDGNSKVDANEFISGCEHFLAEELAQQERRAAGPHKGSRSH